MKKLILSALLIVALSFTANAQKMSKNALGLRIGADDATNGFEFSFQHKLSKANRFELDFGWGNSRNEHDDYNSFKLTGLYQWVWKIDGGLNWYAGLGAGIGSYSDGYYYHKDHYYYENDNQMFASLDGDIGIEYNFDVPLQIALDMRPEIYFNSYHHDNPLFDVGLAIRYRF